jgi:hypothetical protein
MRRFLSAVVINFLAVTLATPAAFAFASEDTAGSGAVTVAPAPAPTPSALRASMERAVVETVAAADRPSFQGVGTPARSKPSGIRMQGGGKTGMVVGLVSAVAGIATTVYMVKYMRDQQKKTETP